MLYQKFKLNSVNATYCNIKVALTICITIMGDLLKLRRALDVLRRQSLSQNMTLYELFNSPEKKSKSGL
ncbi:hypothetical protein BpHYR1_019424 [Brachionus plicatilis]|uniref:Uncharacterized protein n=1 Tax=Brachionus plicatilis TaxID=10195 RepID=A0A3M7RDI2_BRAPC|nr:hypothetical protein BpHYR1_019424 [Brachionus plicatilis]